MGRELPIGGEYMPRGAPIPFKHATHLDSRAGAAPGGRPAAPTLPLLRSTTSVSPATLPLSSRDNIERFGSVAEEKSSPDRQAGAWPDGAREGRALRMLRPSPVPQLPACLCPLAGPHSQQSVSHLRFLAVSEGAVALGGRVLTQTNGVPAASKRGAGASPAQMVGWPNRGARLLAGKPGCKSQPHSPTRKTPAMAAALPAL